MYKKTLSFFAIICFLISNAQNIKKESLFEGTLNGKIIQMYIQSFQQECTGAIYYKSIVRYLDHERDETIWRKFQIFANSNNGYILIDDPWYSGRYHNYIFIEQDGHYLKGFLKNEKLEQKTINLKKSLNIKNFSEYQKKMEEFDDTDDC